MLTFEKEARRLGRGVIAGVDEAGRGPLAGPVVAAAVALPEEAAIEGLTDSKQLSAKKRDELFDTIHQSALLLGVCSVQPETIDSINILQATLLAMRKAVESLAEKPDCILIDGNQKIEWAGRQKTVVKGDSLSLSIAAASVIAKVTRDRIMVEYAKQYPEYGFDRHKGYGSAFHRKAIARYGPCPIHRRTFRGVREYVMGFAAPGHEAQTSQLNLIK
jgi:ribonuclease HII